MSDAQPASGGQEYYIRFRGMVSGPYTLEKLRGLRARGQFSRIHEVSTDRESWSPASSIDDLFAAPASKLASRSGPQTTVAAATAGATPGAIFSAPQPAAASPAAANAADPSAVSEPARSSGAAEALWYYRIDDDQFGPAATGELQKLIGTGRLGRTDIVWRDGLLDWLAVEEVPELIRGGLPPPVRKSATTKQAYRVRMVIRAVIALAISLATALVVYLVVVGKLRLSLTDSRDSPASVVAPTMV
jgi:hypothetical protein